MEGIVVLVANMPLGGATAASDLMPGQPVPLTFSSRAAMISTEIYLADFRALGLLEVHQANLFHPFFVCGVQTERVKARN